MDWYLWCCCCHRPRTAAIFAGSYQLIWSAVSLINGALQYFEAAGAAAAGHDDLFYQCRLYDVRVARGEIPPVTAMLRHSLHLLVFVASIAMLCVIARVQRGQGGAGEDVRGAGRGVIEVQGGDRGVLEVQGGDRGVIEVQAGGRGRVEVRGDGRRSGRGRAEQDAALECGAQSARDASRSRVIYAWVFLVSASVCLRLATVCLVVMRQGGTQHLGGTSRHLDTFEERKCIVLELVFSVLELVAVYAVIAYYLTLTHGLTVAGCCLPLVVATRRHGACSAAAPLHRGDGSRRRRAEVAARRQPPPSYSDVCAVDEPPPSYDLVVKCYKVDTVSRAVSDAEVEKVEVRIGGAEASSSPSSSSSSLSGTLSPSPLATSSSTLKLPLSQEE